MPFWKPNSAPAPASEDTAMYTQDGYVAIPRESAEQILEQMREAYRQRPCPPLRKSMRNLEHYVSHQD